ncbi:zwei Ig domain protein zig-8-like isoform X2 [Penaeus japonicus]|uniref:zwei Ig domain protein zig-8-like isoform X2 n=1 Tax=Penaeus japonicus TaxID=27405 RepID=UPI001C70E1B5|nr:zwei Ig domain protein zig-8-like isoform X2 [Penaeus japonicus]
MKPLIVWFWFTAATLTSAASETLIPPPPLVTDQPYFDSSMLTNHTAYVGRQADLHCRVHSIGNRTVSWIRGRDLRILAVGRYTYTTDLRYEALHQAGTNQWTLRIKSVQPRDQGHYECQISTKPLKAFNTFLTVLEPRIEILGSPDLYVQKASMINLTCILHNLPEPPAYVLWYHSNKFHSNRNISYSSTRGGVSMIVEKGPTTISHLLIQSARVEDTGVYTCVPSNHNATSVTLHVLNGEEPAAMHKNSSLPHTRAGKPPTPVQTNSSVSAASVKEKGMALVAAGVVRILLFSWLHIT